MSTPTYASGGVAPVPRPLVSRPVGHGRIGECHPASEPGDYVNPLARARVTPERIDQGVDYAGSGTLSAIADKAAIPVEAPTRASETFFLNVKIALTILNSPSRSFESTDSACNAHS